MVECSVFDCQRPKKYGDGYCGMHHSRMVRHGDIDRGIRGWTLTSNGYRALHINGEQILEHRHVMEQTLGRKLTTAENVHHLNGDRLDNRIENLEIWSTRQPLGQRIPDKIEFAIEILREYAPELLRELEAAL